jgi:transposase, IS30 family
VQLNDLVVNGQAAVRSVLFSTTKSKEALMNYTQLTQAQRYQIYASMKADWTQLEIAHEIGVHPSTISRELKRNRGGRGYRPKQAQQRTEERKLKHVTTRIPPPTWTLIEGQLRQDWSPEQVAGWLSVERHIQVSHERIYQHIYADKALGGDLHQHLRCRKQRRKRYGSYQRRGQIKGRISIEARPAIVESKRRLGDWEVDTIIGAHHREAIVSVVERKSKLCFLKKVRRKTSEAVELALTALLQPVREKCHTITSDNGKEFANHQAIAEGLQAGFYFAHPYASWERGLNENTNGLVRQYFPKKSDFSKIKDLDVQRAMDRLNNRPRKRLGYKTPNQVFFKQKPIALTT